MADSSFIVKYGFKLLHRSTEEPLFLNMTVWNFLWNYRSSLVMKAKSLVPFMVPIENSGMLHIVRSHSLLNALPLNVISDIYIERHIFSFSIYTYL